ncbi:glycosyl hydrolase family 43 [Planctomycetota bacterium]|nr:glycosyl hydrolase family 43 [Planctomycetota bacterium]
MFKPGKIWNDQDGKPIESHLGGVLFDNGVYYWYGMNFDGPTIPPKTIPKQAYAWFLNRGITIYSSRDLLTWKYERTVLTEVSHKPGELLQPLNGLVRPKIIKNDKTGKFVLLATLTSPDFETFNDVIVAVSDSPIGPFELKGKLGWQGEPNQTGLWIRDWKDAVNDAPTRIRGFDLGLFKDDDGKAYLLIGHHAVLMYELSDDYLSVVRVERLEGAQGESPAVFKVDGTYYQVTSRLSGWAPNQNLYFTAASIWGPWQPRGAFAQGPKAQTTFDSQVTFVLPVANKPRAFIFIADVFHATSGTDVADLRKAVHVWLPIELDPSDQSMRVVWRDQWDVSVFAGS